MLKSVREIEMECVAESGVRMRMRLSERGCESEIDVGGLKTNQSEANAFRYRPRSHLNKAK